MTNDLLTQQNVTELLHRRHVNLDRHLDLRPKKYRKWRRLVKFEWEHANEWVDLGKVLFLLLLFIMIRLKMTSGFCMQIQWFWSLNNFRDYWWQIKTSSEQSSLRENVSDISSDESQSHSSKNQLWRLLLHTKLLNSNIQSEKAHDDSTSYVVTPLPLLFLCFYILSNRR